MPTSVTWPANQALISAPTTATPSAQRRRRARSGSSALFQRAIGPMPIRKIAGAIKGMKTVSKYGGPTEILPRPKASSASGYSVPSNTAAAATTSSTLLASSAVSREISSKRAPRPTLGARHAYRLSDAPIVMTRNARMNRPRRGSVAKACTDDNTPERTRKVPSRDSENAMIASSTVHDLKLPRFSVTASE